MLKKSVKHLNIIYNTTRQWNCGDEFILLGCINIIKSVLGAHNKIIYNRNPDIRPANGEDVYYRNQKLPLDWESSDKLPLGAKYRFGFNDNSIKFNSDLSYVDYAVFAGTPEWANSRCKNFYAHILKNDIPTLFIGMGSMPDYLEGMYMEVIEKSLFFSVRDSGLISEGIGKFINPEYLPCPALFAVPVGKEKKIWKVNTIGLVLQANFQNTVKCQCLNEDTYQKMVDLYKNIIKKYKNKKFKIICHYIDEIELAYKLFGKDVDVLYSYDSKDYIDIYASCDLIISPRVHGSGIASSLGIPSFIIKHDNRGNTADGFLAEYLDIDSNKELIYSQINNICSKIYSQNRRIIKHKKNVFREYKSKISKLFLNDISISYENQYKQDYYGYEEQ